MVSLPPNLLNSITNTSSSLNSSTRDYLKFKEKQLASMQLSHATLASNPNFLLTDSGFQKRASKLMYRISTSLYNLPKSTSFPIPSFQAVSFFKDSLSEHQMKEMKEYPQIYYIGPCEFTPRSHIAYRYEILELIGKGSFGKVFRCYDHRRKELVAIKVIKSARNFGQADKLALESIQKFENCKRIVKLHSSFTFRKHTCLVFELLLSNLCELISNKKLNTPELFKKFTLQITKALAVTHAAGFAHGDLKPENIGIKHSSTVSVKLLDFGSAIPNGCQLFKYIQSRFYRAPEIVLGIKYSHAIDLWSLGCILVEVFIGKILFPATSERDLLQRMVDLIGLPNKKVIESGHKSRKFFDREGILIRSGNRNKTSLSEVIRDADDLLRDLVGKLLVWDPEQRLTAEQVLNHPWLRLQNSQSLKTLKQRDSFDL